MRVGIIGIGQTEFGKISDTSSRELTAEAFREALSEGCLSSKDIATLIVRSGAQYDKPRSPADVFAEYLGLKPSSTFTWKLRVLLQGSK